MNQQRLKDRISDLFNPGRGGVFFFLGWIMLGLLGNAIYELLKDAFGNSAWAHLGIAGGAALVFVGIYGFLWVRLNRPNTHVVGPMRMMLLDYGTHELTTAQLKQVSDMVGEIPDIRCIPVNWDERRPIRGLAVELVDAAQLTPSEWQSAQLLVNPPGLSSLAAAVNAEIHGRCGHWPAMVVIRRNATATPPKYEVAEITDLQALRDEARTRR